MGGFFHWEKPEISGDPSGETPTRLTKEKITGGRPRKIPIQTCKKRTINKNFHGQSPLEKEGQKKKQDRNLNKKMWASTQKKGTAPEKEHTTPGKQGR